MSAPQGPAAPMADVSQASLGELLSGISRDMSTLVRQEVELAKAELRQEAAKAGKVAGMLAAAAVAGFMVLLFLSFAVWWGLANTMDEGWAALIVVVLWAAIGAGFGATANSRLRGLRGMPQTAQTVRKVPDVVKGDYDHRRRGPTGTASRGSPS